MSKMPLSAPLKVRKHFSTSILLWVRTDQPRDTGMTYWREPHSKIISATPGLDEYRQIHLAETNPGLWPATSGVETAIWSEKCYASLILGFADTAGRAAFSRARRSPAVRRAGSLRLRQSRLRRVRGSDLCEGWHDPAAAFLGVPSAHVECTCRRSPQ